MKNWKSLIITVFSFIAIAGTVLFNSCVKDPCTDLKCMNGGSCSNGFCQCPTGYEGAECDITAASRFTGTWVGSLSCDGFPIQADTATITGIKNSPDSITLHLGSGNTSILNYTGLAATPQATFVTYVDNFVTVHTYITVDGGSMQIFEETDNSQLNTRQNCYFSGTRISN